MKVYKTIDSIRKDIRKAKREGKAIGFVPTMGYLHEGHLSLIRKAREESDLCVVSIFVNPIQFGPKEDLKKYPRNLDRDLELCKLNKVDIVFTPDTKEMYKDNARAFIEIEGLTENLCGAKRPGHFRGVATVVAKLFNIVKPDTAYFGQKDAQQAAVVKKLTEDLDIDTKIKVMPIVRETDGLAMSSRNAYLRPIDRKKATLIYQSLMSAQSLYKKGERDSKNIIKQMKELLLKEKNIRIDYISIVNGESLVDIPRVQRGALVAVAVRIGKTRLIDNIVLK
ncbi:MAG: pantoate--beta-alanine ligase [Candidatus Omnitrophota bacterium]